MKQNVFIRFFLFSITILVIGGLFIFIFANISHLEIYPLYITLYIGFCLYCGIGIGVFGHIYAKNTIIYINNTNNTIEDIGNKLDKYKYRKFKETNNEIVFCSSKYREWFYGKIYIQDHGNKITIAAAKCIINKYFSNIV